MPWVVTELVAEDEDTVGGTEPGGTVPLEVLWVQQHDLLQGTRPLGEYLVANPRHHHLIPWAAIHQHIAPCNTGKMYNNNNKNVSGSLQASTNNTELQSCYSVLIF